MNPYMDKHLYAEREMGGSAAVVREEYRNGPPPMPCADCSGTAYYKATVGVRKCDQCGTMYHGTGTRVGGRSC